MINVKNIKNQKFSQIKLVELLFYTFPLSFIIGNFALSLHLLLFILFSLLLIKRQKFDFRFKNSYLILIAFFLYFFLSTTIQFQNNELLKEGIKNWSLEINPVFKSFILIRFLILIFVIDTLFFNKIINIKKIFLFSMICTTFVSCDIIFQYIVGFDFFGIKSGQEVPIENARPWYNSGPFGDEWIAGSYLQKFSFISIFFIFETFKNKNFSSPLLVLIIVLHAIGLLLAGNRMPMILFLFGCFLIILFVKNLRFTMFISLFISFVAFFFIANNNPGINQHYGKVITNFNIVKFIEDKKHLAKRIEIYKTDKDLITESERNTIIDERILFLRGSGYRSVWTNSFNIWKEQPFFGYGLKSFRIKCWEMLEKDNEERKINPRPQNISCGNHSHNYYLELLSEAGIIGFSLMFIFFLFLLKESFYYIKKYNQNINSEVVFQIPLIIIIFLEIWPLRSSGSFFTTWNATLFWLIVGILLAAKKQNNTDIVEK